LLRQLGTDRFGDAAASVVGHPRIIHQDPTDRPALQHPAAIPAKTEQTDPTPTGIRVETRGKDERCFDSTDALVLFTGGKMSAAPFRRRAEGACVARSARRNDRKRPEQHWQQQQQTTRLPRYRLMHPQLLLSLIMFLKIQRDNRYDESFGRLRVDGRKSL
jgi:hypothetical protein